ncbi:S8 family serine peptidase [Sporolactobacillus terrae]|uniref:Peptidase S8 n=1 Tax=Sporolactobacillus terrae TaxID=269673 RepID=A0A5K7WWF4_9BACL|nr:S8 family serine peptidase [Sporolactobacillus terrae]BBN97984.1 hypothetical protein St703_06890 [Sporolactobacillus terrae]
MLSTRHTKWIAGLLIFILVLSSVFSFSTSSAHAERHVNTIKPMELNKADFQNLKQTIESKKKSADIEQGLNTDTSKQQAIIVEFTTDPLATHKPAASLKSAKSFSTATSALQAINKEHADFKASLQSAAKVKSFAASSTQLGYEFKQTFNGMAVKLPGNKIKSIAKLPYVKKVWKDQIVRVPEDKITKVAEDAVSANMDQSRPQIGVDKARKDFGITGKGAKVGVLDTGIDYNHPELKGVYSGGYDFIDNDNDPMETTYNDWKKSGEPEIDPDTGSEYYTSHGTHVSGTIAASELGIAPDVELHVYRVLGPYGSGASSGIIAAIDRAYTDGIDVINLSLGSSDNQPYGADSVAINNFSLAGKTAVISAGNSGPSAGTLGSPGTSPLAITVGASDSPTSTPAFNGAAGDLKLDLTTIATGLGDDVATLQGKEYAVVDCGQGLEGQFDDKALKAQDSIALIQRGGNYFVDNLANAKKHGAKFAIIYNNSDVMFDYSFGASKHYVPSFSLNKAQGDALVAALKKNPILKVNFGTMHTVEKSGDNLADFSSRGPVGLTYDIKPDLTAPGVAIDSTAPYYINAPDNANDYTYAYQMMDGTSMAAPHVTGVAALLYSQAKAEGKTLTPAEVKSDLMSTTDPLSKPWSVFDAGAGRIDAYKALNHPTTFTVQNTSSSLDLNTGTKEEIPYLTGSAAFGAFFDQKARDISKTVKIHNSGASTKTFTLKGTFNGSNVGAPGNGGLTLDLPKSVTVPAGGNASIQLTLHLPSGTAYNSYQGFITATSGSDITRIPFSTTVAKQPVAASADLDRYITLKDSGDVSNYPWENDNVDGYVTMNSPKDSVWIVVYDANTGKLFGVANIFAIKNKTGALKLGDAWNGTYLDLASLETKQAPAGDYLLDYWFVNDDPDDAGTDLLVPLSVIDQDSKDQKPSLSLATKSGTYTVKPSDLTTEVNPETGKKEKAFWIKGNLKDPALDYLWNTWTQRYDYHGTVNGTRDSIQVVPTGKDGKADFKQAIRVKVAADGSFKYPISYHSLTDTATKFFIYGVGYSTATSESAFFSVKKDSQAEAEAAVAKAEKSKLQRDVDAARKQVAALPDDELKTALTKRLDAVQASIDAANTLALAVVNATKAVEKAEHTQRIADVDAARTRVDALPDGPDKTRLLKRLNAIKVKDGDQSSGNPASGEESGTLPPGQTDQTAPAPNPPKQENDGSSSDAPADPNKSDSNVNPPANQSNNGPSTNAITSQSRDASKTAAKDQAANHQQSKTSGTTSHFLPTLGDQINVWLTLLGIGLLVLAARLIKRRKLQ